MQPQLTDRELEIAELIVEDKSYEEIARQLNLALSTVYYYVGNMLMKLNARSRTGIAVWYLRNHERKSA
jgi:two-component system nitrate/nitrite response regulator NarP